MSEYLSEALMRVGMVGKFYLCDVRKLYPEAEAAAFLYAVTGIKHVKPIHNCFDRVVRVSARTEDGVFIDVYMPE